MAKILIVEDDIDLLTRLRDQLKAEKFFVEAVQTGRDAVEHLRFYRYDLIILDWLLPGASGLEVCKQFRDMGGTTPVLMLTARGELVDKEQAFTLGADDYLTKPFQPRELLARMRALLRRPPRLVGNVIEAEDLVLDQGANRVTKDGVEVHLQPLEYALLEFLMRHPGQTYSPDALLNMVWTSDSDASIDTLRTYIKTLRKKIDTEGKESHIKTLRGHGYRFDITCNRS